VNQPREVLARLDRAEREHVGGSAGEPPPVCGVAREHHRGRALVDPHDPLGRQPEVVTHVCGDMVADRVDGGAARDRAAQQRLEILRTGPAELGVPHRGEIVHGDDHSGASRRRHEIGGVHDVDGSRPVLDTRPARPRPQAVGDARRQPRRRGVDPVGQRAGEIMTASPGDRVGGGLDVVACGEPGDDLGGELPDTGALVDERIRVEGDAESLGFRCHGPAILHLGSSPRPRRGRPIGAWYRHREIRLMTSSTTDRPTRLSTARIGLWERLGEIWRYRELLVAFTRTELKVKYKNSVLGFVWSMLNPALYLVVFYVVFQLILGSGIPSFPIFLLSGLLVWNLFNTGVSSATGSVVANAGLVRKVALPREILPLASVGAALLHFFLQAIVLFGALVIIQYHVDVAYLPLLPVALFAMLLFSAALGVLLAAMNVKLRDTAHFVELAMLAWFWMTPIVYPYQLVANKMGSKAFLYLVNPVTDVVLTFQRAIYAQVSYTTTSNGSTQVQQILPAGADQWWYLRNLGIVIVASSALFLFALWLFGRVEGDFAEEL
jgi:ABC-2 type transport system permease protein